MPFALAATSTDGAVASVHPLGTRPLVLLDAAFPLDALTGVEPFARDHTIVVVRLRTNESLASLQERFANAVPWGGQPPVIDASTLLDDGGAFDVSDAVDGVRLLRLGLRLLCDGWPMVALVSAQNQLPASASLATWTASSLRSRSPTRALSTTPLRIPDAETRLHGNDRQGLERLCRIWSARACRRVPTEAPRRWAVRVLTEEGSCLHGDGRRAGASPRRAPSSGEASLHPHAGGGSTHRARRRASLTSVSARHRTTAAQPRRLKQTAALAAPQARGPEEPVDQRGLHGGVERLREERAHRITGGHRVGARKGFGHALRVSALQRALKAVSRDGEATGRVTRFE